MIAVPRALRPVLLLVGALLCSGEAQAAVPFTDFAAGGPVERTAPVFATDGAGAVYGAWTEAARGPILVGRVPRSATAFAETVALPGPIDPEQPDATLASAPLLAADRAGDLTLAWLATSPSGTAVLTATRRAGRAAFSAPQRVAGPAEFPSAPELGVSDDGSALINWTGDHGAVERGVVRRGITGAFSAPQTLFTGGAAEQATVGADGSMAAVRVREEPPAESSSSYGVAVTEVVRKAAGADTFGPVEPIARGTAWPGVTASVAITADGRVWAHQENSVDSSEQGLYVAGAGQPFALACTLFARTVQAPRAGGLLWGGPVVWTANRERVEFGRAPAADPCSYEGAQRGAGSVPDGSTIADIVVGDAPDAMFAAWTDGSGAARRVQTAYLGPPSQPGRDHVAVEETVAADATFLQDATSDAAGNTLLSWDTEAGPRVGLVDHEPPTLTTVEVPEVLPFGTPVQLRASASDAYSAPVRLQWEVRRAVFPNDPTGALLARLDGAAAQYDPVNSKAVWLAHVTVIATDAAGNSSRAVRTLRWLPQPSPVAKPRLPEVRIGAARFRVAKATGAIDTGKASKGRGAWLTLSTDVEATATFTLERVVAGRKSGASCKRGKKRGKPCTIKRPVAGSVTLPVRDGTTTRRLTGRWQGKALSPGRYRLSVVVANAAGKSGAARAAFRIVR